MIAVVHGGELRPLRIMFHPRRDVAPAASCVASVIKKLAFPKPKGGGGVQVNYPFVFRQ